MPKAGKFVKWRHEIWTTITIYCKIVYNCVIYTMNVASLR